MVTHPIVVHRHIFSPNAPWEHTVCVHAVLKANNDFLFPRSAPRDITRLCRGMTSWGFAGLPPLRCLNKEPLNERTKEPWKHTCGSPWGVFVCARGTFRSSIRTQLCVMQLNVLVCGMGGPGACFRMTLKNLPLTVIIHSHYNHTFGLHFFQQV